MRSVIKQHLKRRICACVGTFEKKLPCSITLNPLCDTICKAFESIVTLLHPLLVWDRSIGRR